MKISLESQFSVIRLFYTDAQFIYYFLVINKLYTDQVKGTILPSIPEEPRENIRNGTLFCDARLRICSSGSIAVGTFWLARSSNA